MYRRATKQRAEATAFASLNSAERKLYWGLIANFILFGIVLSIRGATVPTVIRSFGWSYLATGTVLAASSVGYFVATFGTGFLTRYCAPKPILAISLVFEAVCLLLFGRHPSVALNTAINFGIGLGLGASEVVTNYEVIFMERAGESRLMNLMHASFCLGAILGPVAVAGLLRLEVAWTTVFTISGLLALLVSIYFAAIRFPAARGLAGSGENGKKSTVTALLVLLFGALLLYVGVEIGVANWISEYFMRELNAGIAASASVGSVFWAGILLGRLGLSFAYRGARQERILVLLCCASTLALLATVVSRRAVIAAVCVFLAGLAYSGVYPLVMVIVGRRFRDGVAIGIVTSGGGIGAFVFPFLIALFADQIGLQGAFLFCVGVNAVLAIAAFATLRTS